jgi:hypothetical protein
VNWISLSTSSLDICKGRVVVIDGDAYSLMWNVLDEIIVKVDGSLVGALESGMSIKSLSRPSFHQIHQIFLFLGKPTRPGTLNAMTEIPASTPIPGPSHQQPHDNINRAIHTAQTANGPVDHNKSSESTARNLRLTIGKGKEESNHLKSLEVPAPLPNCKPDEVQLVIEEPSEDPKDSPSKLLFKKGDPSTPNLNSNILPPISKKKSVNQPNIVTLRQGTHSSFISVS